MKKIIILLVCMFIISGISAQNLSAKSLYGGRGDSKNLNATSEIPLPNPTPNNRGVLNISEGFDDISTLVGNGWYMQNNSTGSGSGTTGWFQGNSGIFTAHDGALNAYIAANYNNAFGSNATISNWLITPTQTLNNGDEMTFWTRVVENPVWCDRLQVRISTNGASTDVGNTPTSVGDFDILLLDINPTYNDIDYPETWTQYTCTVSGLSGAVEGRFAFRYFVEDGGPQGANSNYIGIDRVEFTEAPPSVPLDNWAIVLTVILIGIFTVVVFIRRMA